MKNPGFTRRERDVAQLVARGIDNCAIADRLGITEGTVKVFLSRMYHKFGLNRGRVSARVQLGLLYVAAAAATRYE
jgi:DNA-binding NarL/FixJ family response regulator